MKKALSFLSAYLIIFLLLTMRTGLPESNFSGIPFSELGTRLAYRCSSLDSDFNIDNISILENGKVDFDGYLLCLGSIHDSLPVIEITVYLLKNGNPATVTSVTRTCALIAALENEMPPISKIDNESESKAVKKDAFSIIEKISDILETNLFNLMSGDDVLCYSGNQYNYYLHYADGDILLRASVQY